MWRRRSSRRRLCRVPRPRRGGWRLLALTLALGVAVAAGAQEEGAPTGEDRRDPGGTTGDAGIGWEVRAPWEDPDEAAAGDAAAESTPGAANPCGSGAAGAGAGDDAGHNPCRVKGSAKDGAEDGSANPCGGSHGPELDSLIHEFMSTGEAVRGRPGGQQEVSFPGPPGRPNWFQALAVTSDENPLLERQCKEDAMALSVDSLRHVEGAAEGAEAMQAAVAHMQEHQRFIRENRVSYADYLKEIAECRSFCAPLVASLVRCHVLSVARQPHGIVGFELDSSVVEPEFREGILEEVALRLEQHPEEKVLLVGRASRIGDLRYNRRLSAQRALAVKDHLVAHGVDESRIETMWLGWEPPQITESVAAEYGIAELYRSQGVQSINQSVMVVTYPRSAPEPL